MANNKQKISSSELLLVSVRETDSAQAQTRADGDAEWDDGSPSKFKRRAINKKDLAGQMQTFCKALGEIIDNAATAMSNYELDEVKVNVEVTSNGQISLLAAGGGMSATGGLEFTFKRSKTPRPPKSR